MVFVDCWQIGLQSGFSLTKIQCVTQDSRNVRMAWDECYELNLSGRCFRNNNILSYYINSNKIMVKQDSVVKLSNFVVPCSEKESKADCGFLESYRAMSAYSRKGMDGLFDQENKKSCLVLR